MNRLAACALALTTALSPAAPAFAQAVAQSVSPAAPAALPFALTPTEGASLEAPRLPLPGILPSVPAGRPLAKISVRARIRRAIARKGLASAASMARGCSTGNPAGVSDDEAGSRASAAFDGSKTKPEDGVAAPSWKRSLLIRLSLSPLHSLVPRKAYESLGAVPSPEAGARDPFGGPPKLKEEIHLSDSVVFGLKWGVNIVAIGALIFLAVKPLASHFPWLLAMPGSMLEWSGRTELLVNLGPRTIIAGLSRDPLSFLTLDLIGNVVMEEIAFRFLQFGTAFALLAAAKPGASWLSDKLSVLPEHFRARDFLRKQLDRIGRLSSHAYPLAALFSSFSFAAAHVPAWGLNPASFAFHFAAGLALAHAAARTRGLAAPIFAHLTYGALTIISFYLLPGMLAPGLAAAVSTALRAGAVVFLLRQTPLYGRLRALGWRRITASLLLGPLLLAGILKTSLDDMAFPPQGPPAAVKTLMAGEVEKALGGEAPAEPAPPPSAQAAESLPDMVAKAKPSVVEIKTSFGSGSGFVAGDKGLIVTNAHVVDSLLPGQPATVKLQDGRAVPARVVAFNAGKDLAFLQAAAPSGLTWRALPVSKEGVREGDSIVAMGHPFGLPFTVTRGIVSGVDERGNPFVDHVQHDAGVNPGNSGGPLLNAKGEVVGVNVAILSPSGAFNGISFAISAKDLGSALEQYARIGNIDTARLGIIVNPLDARAPDYGAFVEAVRPSSPAEAAGVKPGDVIVSMDGKAFLDPGKAPEGLQRAAVRKAPDSPVEIQVVRGSRLLTLELPGGK